MKKSLGGRGKVTTSTQSLSELEFVGSVLDFGVSISSKMEARLQERNIEKTKILLKRSEMEIASNESTVERDNKTVSFKSWILSCYS